MPWYAGRLRAAFFFCLLATPAFGAAQDAAAGASKAQPCFACHGPKGNSVVPQFPNLAGQTARYIYLQLRDYQEDRRRDPVMQPLAKPLARDDMLDIAAFFAAQKPQPNGFQADPQRAARGKAKADETLCTMCHLGGFAGQNEIPRVAGQQYDYTVKQLRDFKARVRTNDAGNMTSVARTLSDQDIEDLAHYTASLF
ncbi:MAG TPA: c-type cytochrome [Burkholderiales bacterium]|jgi:cytochrome c553|nr:c-type cytochrome [Burkholderiales bacterium]